MSEAPGKGAAPNAATRERMRELVAVAAPCWAGEAEIVRAYFARPRTPERDAGWLCAQAWKETRHLRALRPEQQEEFLRTGAVRDHPEGEHGTAKLAEEMKHYRLIADLVRERTGREVGFRDLVELPEETRLQALRQPWREGSVFERTLVDFTEGGGGAMYWELARLDVGDFERRCAAAFRAIHVDEVLHGPGQVHALAELASGPADWERAQSFVAAVGRQRLRMRNEMFGFPLDDARLDRIAGGEIEPWPMPVDI